MIEISHAGTVPLHEFVQLWNLAYGPSLPMTERLLRQTMECDPYYEPGGNLVARDGDRIVGWALCKSMQSAGPEMGRFQGRGGLGALCVHPDYQRRGIASQLLDRVEAYLQENGSQVTTLYFPHHFLPGIPADNDAAVALFRKRGYTGFHECVDLWRELDDYELPAKAVKAIDDNPSVQLRPAIEADEETLMTMVAHEFPGGWTYSTKRHFRQGCAPSDIIIAVEHGAVIGFCHNADWRSPWLLPNVYWHELLGEQYGGLGPVGMAAAHRKRGLGLALTAVAVADLKRRGVRRMAIDWTVLIDFYGQMGFKVWKRYLQAELKPAGH